MSLPKKQVVFKKYSFIKYIAQMVCCFMLFPHISWCFEPANYSVGDVHLSYQGQTINIPKTLGSIADVHLQDGPLVFHFQDLHCHYEVQKNVSALLEYLADHYGIQLIGVEGASQAINVTHLRNYPDRTARRHTCDYFMKQGQLSGAEYCAATSRHELSLVGIEDQGIYDQSLEATRMFLTDENLGLISDLRDRFVQLKLLLYNNALQKHDVHRSGFRQSERTFLAYAAYLIKTGKTIADQSPDYKPLLKFVSSYHTGLFEEDDYDELYRLAELLDNAIRNELYDHPSQLQLDESIEKCLMLERLLNISATIGDLQNIRNNPSAYRLEMILKMLAQLSGESDTTLDQELLPLNSKVEDVLTFYQLADKRSTVFVNNTLTIMRKQKQQKAVLITGGFHTEEVLSKLKMQGASYVSIRPRLTEENIINPYFSLIRDRRSSLEKLLLKNQTIIALAPLMPQVPLYNQDGLLTLTEEQELSEKVKVFLQLARLMLQESSLLQLLSRGKYSIDGLKNHIDNKLELYPYGDSMRIDWEQAERKNGVFIFPLKDTPIAIVIAQKNRKIGNNKTIVLSQLKPTGLPYEAIIVKKEIALSDSFAKPISTFKTSSKPFQIKLPSALPVWIATPAGLLVGPANQVFNLSASGNLLQQIGSFYRQLQSPSLLVDDKRKIRQMQSSQRRLSDYISWTLGCAGLVASVFLISSSIAILPGFILGAVGIGLISLPWIAPHVGQWIMGKFTELIIGAKRLTTVISIILILGLAFSMASCSKDDGISPIADDIIMVDEQTYEEIGIVLKETIDHTFEFYQMTTHGEVQYDLVPLVVDGQQNVEAFAVGSLAKNDGSATFIAVNEVEGVVLYFATLNKTAMESVFENPTNGQIAGTSAIAIGIDHASYSFSTPDSGLFQLYGAEVGKIDYTGPDGSFNTYLQGDFPELDAAAFDVAYGQDGELVITYTNYQQVTHIINYVQTNQKEEIYKDFAGRTISVHPKGNVELSDDKERLMISRNQQLFQQYLGNYGSRENGATIQLVNESGTEIRGKDGHENNYASVFLYAMGNNSVRGYDVDLSHQNMRVSLDVTTASDKWYFNALNPNFPLLGLGERYTLLVENTNQTGVYEFDMSEFNELSGKQKLGFELGIVNSGTISSNDFLSFVPHNSYVAISSKNAKIIQSKVGQQNSEFIMRNHIGDQLVPLQDVFGQSGNRFKAGVVDLTPENSFSTKDYFFIIADPETGEVRYLATIHKRNYSVQAAYEDSQSGQLLGVKETTLSISNDYIEFTTLDNKLFKLNMATLEVESSDDLSASVMFNQNKKDQAGINSGMKLVQSGAQPNETFFSLTQNISQAVFGLIGMTMKGELVSSVRKQFVAIGKGKWNQGNRIRRLVRYLGAILAGLSFVTAVGVLLLGITALPVLVLLGIGMSAGIIIIAGPYFQKKLAELMIKSFTRAKFVNLGMALLLGVMLAVAMSGCVSTRKVDMDKQPVVDTRTYHSIAVVTKEEVGGAFEFYQNLDQQDSIRFKLYPLEVKGQESNESFAVGTIRMIDGTFAFIAVDQVKGEVLYYARLNDYKMEAQFMNVATGQASGKTIISASRNQLSYAFRTPTNGLFELNGLVGQLDIKPDGEKNHFIQEASYSLELPELDIRYTKDNKVTVDFEGQRYTEMINNEERVLFDDGAGRKIVLLSHGTINWIDGEQVLRYSRYPQAFKQYLGQYGVRANGAVMEILRNGDIEIKGSPERLIEYGSVFFYSLATGRLLGYDVDFDHQDMIVNLNVKEVSDKWYLNGLNKNFPLTTDSKEPYDILIFNTRQRGVVQVDAAKFDLTGQQKLGVELGIVTTGRLTTNHHIILGPKESYVQIVEKNSQLIIGKQQGEFAGAVLNTHLGQSPFVIRMILGQRTEKYKAGVIDLEPQAELINKAYSILVLQPATGDVTYFATVHRRGNRIQVAFEDGATGQLLGSTDGSLSSDGNEILFQTLNGIKFKLDIRTLDVHCEESLDNTGSTGSLLPGSIRSKPGSSLEEQGRSLFVEKNSQTLALFHPLAALMIIFGFTGKRKQQDPDTQSGVILSEQTTIAQRDTPLINELAHLRSILPDQLNRPITEQRIGVKIAVGLFQNLLFAGSQHNKFSFIRIIPAIIGMSLLAGRTIIGLFASLSNPLKLDSKTVNDHPKIKSLKALYALPEKATASAARIKHVEIRMLSEQGGFIKRLLKGMLFGAYQENGLQNQYNEPAVIYVPDALVQTLLKTEPKRNWQRLFYRVQIIILGSIIGYQADRGYQKLKLNWIKELVTSQPVLEKDALLSGSNKLDLRSLPLASSWYSQSKDQVALGMPELQNVLESLIVQLPAMSNRSGESSKAVLEKLFNRALKDGAKPGVAAIVFALKRAPKETLPDFLQVTQTMLLEAKELPEKQRSIVEQQCASRLLTHFVEGAIHQLDQEVKGVVAINDTYVVGQPQAAELQLKWIESIQVTFENRMLSKNEQTILDQLEDVRRLVLLISNAECGTLIAVEEKTATLIQALLLRKKIYQTEQLTYLGDDLGRKAYALISGRMQSLEVNFGNKQIVAMAAPYSLDLSVPLTSTIGKEQVMAGVLADGLISETFEGKTESIQPIKQHAFSWISLLSRLLFGRLGHEWAFEHHPAEYLQATLTIDDHSSALGALLMDESSPVYQSYRNYSNHPRQARWKRAFIKSMLRVLKAESQLMKEQYEAGQTAYYKQVRMDHIKSVQTFNRLMQKMKLFDVHQIGVWLDSQPRGTTIPLVVPGLLLRLGGKGAFGVYNDILHELPVKLDEQKMELQRRRLFRSTSVAA